MLLVKNEFDEQSQTYSFMKSSVFVFADAAMALSARLAEITEGINAALDKYELEKDNLTNSLTTMWSLTFHERGNQQYRIQMIAKYDMQPQIGLAAYWEKWHVGWIPLKGAVFMPKNTWDRFYEALPEIMSSLCVELARDRGALFAC